MSACEETFDRMWPLLTNSCKILCRHEANVAANSSRARTEMLCVSSGAKQNTHLNHVDGWSVAVKSANGVPNWAENVTIAFTWCP